MTARKPQTNMGRKLRGWWLRNRYDLLLGACALGIAYGIAKFIYGVGNLMGWIS